MCMLEGEKFSKLAASSEIISNQPLFNQPTVQRALETSDARALTMLTMFAAKTMALSLHWRIERQSIKSANPCIGCALMLQFRTSGWVRGNTKVRNNVENNATKNQLYCKHEYHGSGWGRGNTKVHREEQTVRRAQGLSGWRRRKECLL